MNELVYFYRLNKHIRGHFMDFLNRFIMANLLQSLKITSVIEAKKMLFLGLYIGLGLGLSAQPTSQTYNTAGSHTYVVPPNYGAIVTVQAWGGGGRGGTGAEGGGGGGGAYASSTITLSAGSYAVVVGAGGSSISANGGSSSFTASTSVIAVGGLGAGASSTGANGGAAGSCTGTIVRSGGQGANGAPSNNGGGGGEGANSDSDGAAGSGRTGGSSGDGGNGGTGGQNAIAGLVGATPGGGGGGQGNNGGSAGNGGVGTVIVTVTTVLPVELASFTAKFDNLVTLNWQTSTELNNDKFIIETSTEGEVFNRIGEIDGAGTTTETHDYTFTHRTPSAGINYYRLKQVDFDGTFEYSKVIAINAPGSKDIFAFPNPAKDKITVQYDRSKGAGNIQLFDALGRRVNANIAGYAGNYEVKLPDGLAKGTYWLKVERGGQVQTVPVVKE